MQTELFETLRQMEADFAAHAKDNDMRRRLQNYFDALHTCEQTAGVSPQFLSARVGGLRLLRALQNGTPPQKSAPCFCVPLSALCESTAFCGDLLCGKAGKRVFFTGAADISALCRPHAVLWAVLNLLSNALLHGTGRYVFLSTARVGKQAAVTVSDAGAYSVPAFFKAQTHAGGGLWFAAQTARLHGGGLYLSKSADFAAVTLTLPTAAETCPQWILPDFTDWLADGLSPIYTALCDSIFPNVAP